MFFDRDNPFITRVNEIEAQILEGILTITEALKSLKSIRIINPRVWVALQLSFIICFGETLEYFL